MIILITKALKNKIYRKVLKIIISISDNFIILILINRLNDHHLLFLRYFIMYVTVESKMLVELDEVQK